MSESTNDRAVLNLRTSSVPTPLLKVLSHALPSPSQTGHAYTSIIEAIHDSTPSSPTAWINLFHAIPGRFNLEELPTSPPNTPGPPIEATTTLLRKSSEVRYRSPITKPTYHRCLAHPGLLSLLTRSTCPLLSATSLRPAHENSRACLVSTDLQY